MSATVRTTHHHRPVLLGQVGDGCRGEVEVAGLERAQHHRVGDVASAGPLVKEGRDEAAAVTPFPPAD